MEHSSSGSADSDSKEINKSRGEARSDAQEQPAQRMVADRLMAALASGNLDHLAQARRAFLKQPPAHRKQEIRPSSSATPRDEIMPPPKHAPADLAAPLERRSGPRRTEHDFLPVDELRKIEEELHHAEAELQRRRVEVAAAKRMAEEEAKRLAFEESRRKLETEARQRAEEEERRLAVLQNLRDQAEAATREREYQQRELDASFQSLKIAEQEATRQIAEAEVRIRQSEDQCRRLHVEAQQRAERVLWLNEEIEDLKKAETEQVKLAEATEARLLAQVEAKHVASADAQRRAQKLADDERHVSEELEAVRGDEARQQESLSRLTGELVHLKETQQAAAKRVAEATAQEQQLKAAIDQQHADEQLLRQRIAAAEERSRETEQAYLAAKIEAELRDEQEQKRIAEFASQRTDLDTAAQRNAEKIHALNSEIGKLREEEVRLVKLVRKAEAHLQQQHEINRKADNDRAHAEAELRERMDALKVIHSQIEGVRAAEQQSITGIEAARAALHERQRRAETDARQSVLDQQTRIIELEELEQRIASDRVKHAQEEEQLKTQLDEWRRVETEQLARLEALRNQIATAEKSRGEHQASFEQAAAKEKSLQTEIESLGQNERDLRKRIAEVEGMLIEQRKTYQHSVTQAKLQEEKEQTVLQELEAVNRAEKERFARIETLKQRISQLEEEVLVSAQQEQQLSLTLRGLHEKHEDQIKRLKEIQSHLDDRVKACYLTEAESQELAEKARLVNTEHERIVRNKDSHAKSVSEAQTRLRLLTELKHGGQISAQRRTETEQNLAAEIDALRQAEAEQINRVQLAEARLKEHNDARETRKTRVKELSDREQQLLTEIEDLRRREIEHLNRVKEAEARIPGHEEAVRQAEAQARRKADEEAERLKQLELTCIKAQTEATQRAEREKQLCAQLEILQKQEAETEPFELLDTKAIVISDAHIIKELTPLVDSAHEPWPTSDPGEPEPQAEIEQELLVVDPGADFMADYAPDHFQSQGISGDISQRLQSADSSQRAAALADLADAGGNDAFGLITKCFDDPSIEVRNAAARALHSWQSDVDASFTRALREASPERRRKIGAAIAGSGLAANAINSLSGEGRGRAYDAFSILFLMAKAGEAQPLMQAIAEHHDVEVRLIAVKLIGLSKQQHVLPGLRTMASRDQLPPKVHTAVMQAIYLLSSQTREGV